MANTIIKGDKVRVKVSNTAMTTPWIETEGETNGTYVETAYKYEQESTKDSADTTVFLDEYKTKVFLKKDINITLTCRHAVGDPGQELIQEAEEANEDFFIAYTKDYTSGSWTMLKVACESYNEGLDVGSISDVSYKLALAPGAVVTKLTQPAEEE